MNQSSKLLRRCLTGKDGDLAAVAHPQCGRDGLLELKLDALDVDEVDQAFAILAYLSGGALGEPEKLCAFGLAYIEDVDGTKSDEDGRVDCCRFIAAFSSSVFPLAAADHRSNDTDALLPLHDLAANV